ncbi:MAG: nucleoside-diphosphate kinase [Alphaproteobacteria bacterium]
MVSSQNTANQRERTLSIIKPDATRRNLIGKINDKFESGGLKIIAMKKTRLTFQEACDFYAVHKEREFFKSLCEFMTSGPIVVQVLEGENAVARHRDIMGATDPKKADDGTIRKEFAESIEANSVHGSDSLESAQQEIAFFFTDVELVG